MRALCTLQVYGIPFLMYHYVHIMLAGEVTTWSATLRRWFARGRIEELEHVSGQACGCVPNTVEVNESSILHMRGCITLDSVAQ